MQTTNLHGTVHAKGLLLKGSFIPTDMAKSLSIAPHFNHPVTPVIARFSSSTGLPELPDTDPNGNPHGFAVRFMLAETPRRVHTDIVAHSTPFFPASTGEEALAFFRSLADGSVGSYLAAHPAAAAFVSAPKPTPASLAHETYYGINAFKLVDSVGKETFVRYRWLPAAGRQVLSEEDVKGKSSNFLYDELPGLVGDGKAIKFKLVGQVAADGDVTNDCTVHWPEDRPLVELGTLKLDSVLENNAAQQKTIIFDPIPRVQGIEASDDPIIPVRAGVYLISGRERRAA